MSQELKKEFIYLQKIKEEVDNIDQNNGSLPISGLQEDQIDKMFKCFDQLVEDATSKSQKSLKKFTALESNNISNN